MNYITVRDQSLINYNTMGLNSLASIMVFPLNDIGVKETYEKYYDREIIVIGRGSNVILSQEYYDENYVFVNLKLMDYKSTDGNEIYAQSGVSLSNISWFALENNFRGFEFLEDIPGTVGGAIIMNASTFNNSIGNLIKKIRVYDINKNEIIDYIVNCDDFEYRNSKWARYNNVILGAWFKGENGNYIDSLEELLTIKKKRYLKQPRNFPNAGSVFKRPFENGQELQVWKLLDDIGLRGYRKGGAMISDKHPGFIVNTNNAKFEDILYLVDLCKEKVLDKYGIELELEWRII